MTDQDQKPTSGDVGSKFGLVPQKSAKQGKLASILARPSSTNVKAKSGSVGIGGDNTGTVVNAGGNVTFNLNFEHHVARELPSVLSRVVTWFSEETLSKYDSGPMRTLPPEVVVKIAYNNFPPGHYILTYYAKYCNILEASYRGVEQRNDDARRLVRYRAAVTYQNQLYTLCETLEIPAAEAHKCARINALILVMAVVSVLFAEFKAGGNVYVTQEVAQLAIGLIVADAVIECDVLERPLDAVAS